MNREIIYPIVFCAAIVAANLLVGWLGPKATPFIAFFLIGLDLSLRDKIHEVWHGKGLIWKMSPRDSCGSYYLSYESRCRQNSSCQRCSFHGSNGSRCTCV